METREHPPQFARVEPVPNPAASSTPPRPGLGEAGVPTSDAYYGDTSTSPVSLDYFRQKYAEFQSLLLALDEAYRAALALWWDPPAGADTAELDRLLQEYEARAASLKGTAEAMNMGAAVVNAAGGRLPPLAIPATLGLPPLALPLAAVAAVATAATLIAWGTEWMRQVGATLRGYMLLQSVPEADRAKVATALAEVEKAERVAQASSLGALGNIGQLVKWGAIGLGAFLLYRAVAPMLSRKANPALEAPEDDDEGDDSSPDDDE